MARSGKAANPREPVLEWIASAIGLALTIGVVLVIGREALNGETKQPPAIEVRATRIVPQASGYLVEIEAANRSGGTAAIVEIEGALMAGDSEAETSGLTFDYVPGHATRKGGLFFREDPSKHRLELRALGYQAP
jgi:uncharacterized protein (TIGR02588 family)